MLAAWIAQTLVDIDTVRLDHLVSWSAGTFVGTLCVVADVMSSEEFTWELFACALALVGIGTEAHSGVLLVTRLALAGVGSDAVDALLGGGVAAMGGGLALVDVGAFSVLLGVSVDAGTGVSSVCVSALVDAAWFAGLTLVDVNTFLSVLFLETTLACAHVGSDGVSTSVFSAGALCALVNIDALVAVVLLVTGDAVTLVATQCVLAVVDAADFLGELALVDIDALAELEVHGVSADAGTCVGSWCVLADVDTAWLSQTLVDIHALFLGVLDVSFAADTVV